MIDPSYLGPPCPLCGKRGTFSEAGGTGEYCAPVGHTVYSLDDDSDVRFDRCRLMEWLPDA